MKNVLIAATFAVALSAPAFAVSVRDCDGTTDSLRNIAEPWSKNTKQFYNNQVRVTLVDTGGEPVCCSSHLVVIFPTVEEPGGYNECKLIESNESSGFLQIGFDKLVAKYDPKKGLTMTFLYMTYVDGIKDKPGNAKIRLDLKAGKIIVEK